MTRLNLLARFIAFRRELATLWRAFIAPETPLHLKVLMLLVPTYLLMPVDLIPDFIPILGWVDDVVVVSMLVGWIMRLLPQRATRAADARDPRGGPTIDGTYRRM